MKRMVALFSVVLMVIFAVPVMTHAEESTTLTVTADKTVAKPGDRVEFSLMIGAVKNLGGMTVYLDIPKGLSIDYGSVVLPEGVVNTLDASEDVSIPTELNENLFSFEAKKNGYTGTANLCILKFTCTVDSGSVLETKSVGLKVVDIGDNNFGMINTTMQAAQLRIEGTEQPVATPTPTPGAATPTPTPGAATPTPTPGAATPTPTPGAATPTPTQGAATPTPVPAPTATPAPAPTATPIPAPTATPAPAPTATPTPAPTATPEVERYYLADLEDLIEEVETGTTIRISKKDDINALNRNILRRLNERGVSLEMEYTYEGKNYKIFIPAGKAVIDEDVFYCGPLYLAGLYGNNFAPADALVIEVH